MYYYCIILQGFPNQQNRLVSSQPVFVKLHPYPPTHLFVTFQTLTTALVRWDEPEDSRGSPVTDYILEMREADDKDWCILPVEGLVYKHTVCNLKENTTYMFRVAAQNYDRLFSEYNVLQEPISATMGRYYIQCFQITSEFCTCSHDVGSNSNH